MRSVTELIASLGGRTRVAAALGLPYYTVQRWYTDGRIPSRDQAVRLAALAGVAVSEIWEPRLSVAERDRLVVSAAIDEMERYSREAYVSEWRRAELRKRIADLYGVLARMSPRRYVGTIDVPGGTDDDECGMRRIGADKVGFRVSGGGADHVSE